MHAPRGKKKPTAQVSHTGLFGYPDDPEAILKSPKKISEFLRRKKAKEAKEVLQRLRILDEVIPQIVWTADPGGYQDYFNRHWFTYTGLTQEETYAGKTALHPEDFPLYVTRWTEALKTGKAYEAEYRFWSAADKAYKWHLVRGVPIRGRNGRIVKWLGTFTDIHALKEAEKKLLRANQKIAAEIKRLRTVMSVMPLGAIVADESGVILHMNELCRSTFSMAGTHEEWIGRSLHAFFHAAKKAVKNQDAFRSVFNDLQSPDRGGSAVELHLTNDRIVLFEHVSVVESGESRGYFLLFRDVTRERRVDAAKSEFMSLVSHQLRTPLTSIRWALDVLSKQQGVPLDIVQPMLQAASRMAETINTILSISRIESGELLPDCRDVPIPPLLQDILARHKPKCLEKRLKLSLETNDIGSFHTDRHLLQEIVENLLTNAIKYSHAGGEISIRSFPVSGGVQIDVQDHGLSIPEAQQKKIFSKFFRADNVVSKGTDGTGLGLYLASSLAKLICGTLTFVSREGEGSTFSLRLKKCECCRND